MLAIKARRNGNKNEASRPYLGSVHIIIMYKIIQQDYGPPGYASTCCNPDSRRDQSLAIHFPADNDVVIIRIELLAVHIMGIAANRAGTVTAALPTHVLARVHDVGCVLGQVSAAWLDVVVVVVAQPDRVGPGARNAHATPGIDAAAAGQALQVLDLILTRVTRCGQQQRTATIR